MKARIPPQPNPKILVYPVDSQAEKWKMLNDLCAEEQIQLQMVTAAQLGQSVGWLCGAPGYEGKQASFTQSVPQRDAMVFCAVSQDVLYSFLQKMREREIGVELKAMLTPNNQKWAFGDLLLELEREHLAMGKGQNDK